MTVTAASLALKLADFEAQTLNLLFSATGSKQSFASVLDGQLQDEGDNSPIASSLSSNGRNMSLFDPEAAYRMMSDINNRDVTYKAQFSELSAMGERLQDMEVVGDTLGDINSASSNESIKASLQAFIEQYNSWIQRFGEDLGKDGLLANTQAAQVSQYELEQSVKYLYNGAEYGMQGMSDVGVSIDPVTHLASLDPTILDTALASNKAGVVDTVQDFSANFVKSADLLTSENNFIPRQQDNLQRAISYISSNISSWRQEFGTGDAATPSHQVTQALAAYNQNYAA